MPLYLVATPLGNLGDLSPRVREILAAVPVLAAEDTRSARRLLELLGLPLSGRELVSYGEHNEKMAAPRLAEKLRAGQDVAIFSESGTPLVSDPGFRLVRAALDAGVPVTPIPGPCAAIAALVASGLPVHAFLFRGFLPRRPGARGRILEDLREREETLIFYESPRRVARLAEELAARLGASRRACLAREITKLHETFLRLPLGELAERLRGEDGRPGGIRGECVLLVAGVSARAPAGEEPGAEAEAAGEDGG